MTAVPGSVLKDLNFLVAIPKCGTTDEENIFAGSVNVNIKTCEGLLSQFFFHLTTGQKGADRFLTR